MPSLDEFRKHAIPVYMASEYWYCAAKIYHSTRLGRVPSEQKHIGREMHELKATEDLQSLKGVIAPILPESVEQLKELMSIQVGKAISDKIILTNSDETTLYCGILSELNCIGKPDAVDCTDGINPVVIERKFVKYPPSEPWLDHKIQAQLYMMTLQELGFPSVKSRIEYWGQDDNQPIITFELRPEDELKEKAIQGIDDTAQILKGSNELIPTKNPNKCRVCEYRVFCKWRADVQGYSPPYFLDIETNIEGTLVWCVGIFDAVEAKFTQFFLEPEADEPSMLRDGLQLLSQRPSSRILSFSGSAFESRILRKRLEAHNFGSDISRRILDVHPKICWELKLKSTGGLKLLSSKYGYNYKYEMDGSEAASLYGDYQKSKKQSIRSLLLRYNEDDVMALIYLAMRIPDAFDYNRFVTVLDDRERELLRRFYESSRLIIRKDAHNIELRFRYYDEENGVILRTLLEAHGFNPRFGVDKNTRVIRMYGYSQVSDFLSILGDNLDKIIADRSLNER
jgi:CRISPR/Cas system-associated exonuclease Cas4 (RecB family)